MVLSLNIGQGCKIICLTSFGSKKDYLNRLISKDGTYYINHTDLGCDVKLEKIVFKVRSHILSLLGPN